MPDRGLVVILLGPPGVGKGTQGLRLAAVFGWERLVTGDLLRAARREGTEVGRRAGRYMDEGELVPDDVMVALFEERMARLPDDAGVLLDGFPRTVAQAEALTGACSRPVDAVVLLEASDDVLIRRISGRRSCAACGSIYNIYFDPPGSEGVCDRCGEVLTHREDDTAETVHRRLRVYVEQTETLIDYYGARGAVLRVDGEKSPDEVQAGLEASLASHFGAIA